MRIEDMKSSFRKKKSISIVAVLLFFTFLFVNQITAKAGTGIVYGENGIITRAEWLHDLALIFEMSVEDENYPDNYFSDLSGESEYYYDVLLTVQFGLIDVEAGGEIAPNEVVTREFAAHTLNFCLGYQLEESESYTFDDADNCSYPADAQVALNREWFAAVNGMFSPEAEVTAGEVRKMIEDAQVVMQEMTVDEEYENQYEFADADVKEIPQGILVEKDEDTLRITDCPISLKSGDKFVVYFDGLPGAYVAGDVSTEGNITSVQVTQSDAENIFEDIDAQGVVDVDLSQAEAEEDAEITYIDESADKNSKERAVPRAVRQISRSLSVLKKVNLGRGLTAEVALKMKNPKIEYKINLGKREAYAKLMGDTEITYKIKGDSAVAAGLGKIPMIKATVPGVGGFSMNLELEASGAITGIQKGYLTAGIGYSDAGGFRIIKGFQTQAFTLTVEATVSAGIQAQFGITDVPGNILRAYVYAKAGGRAVLKSSTFSDGNLPGRCTHYAAYIYAEYGAEAGVNFGFYKRSISLNETIYNENNSPIRVVKHYEDGRQVASCTRGLKWGSSYYTRWNSRYGGSGWYGGAGLYGLDETGNPVEIYTYTVDGEGNATIAGYRGNVAALTVPDEIDGHTVVAIGNGAFEGNKSVKSMVLPDTVTSIKSSAFAGSVLSSMVLPPNVTELGDLILDGNTGVEEISIPRTVSIHGWNGKGVFEGSGIRKAVFERGMTEIPVEIMKGSLYLNEVSIPDSVTSIGARAFEDCESLKQIQLLDSIISIDENAFRNCGLTSIKIPNSTADIGIYIFSNCRSLEEVILPERLQNIPRSMCEGCIALTRIAMPETVKSVGQSAFKDCTTLETIKWSKNTKTIQREVFKNCSALKSFQIPDVVISIENNAFSNCDALESIRIPDTVTSIGYGLFEDCDALREVSLGVGLTSIPDSCFEHCDALESLILPYRIKSIGENAFKNSVKFTSITIPRATTSIPSTAFSYPAKMTVYGVPGTYAETFATEQNIRFVAKEIKAAAALLNQKVITLNRGDTARLALSVEPADFTDEVSWKCTDTDIATVDDGGVVTASGVGNATIKVTVGDVSASCAVIVQEPVSGIWLNATQLTLEALDTYQMEANIWPEDAYNKEIEWLTSNAEIASVDNAGLITAQKKGTAIITAKAKDGSDVSAACEVTVSNTVYWVSSVEELESPHNYLNECSDFWIYTLPRKADSLDVRFDERTEVEENFDFLYIYGGDGAEMGRYTGKELAGKTIAVPGNILKIKLVSDNAGNTWGFKVASITVDGEEQDEPEEPVQPGNPGGISAPERPELPIVKPPVQAVVSRPPSVGMKVTDPVSKAVYKVTGAAYAEYSESSDKKMSNVKIPDKVTLAGKSYKVTTVASEAFKNCKKLKSVVIGKGVTAIGAKAFFGCKSLKKITIKSTQLRKVGKKAFKRIHAKAVIKVPKAKLKAYKKLLKKKGQGKKVRILK